MTLRTLNYGNYGTFLIMGNAGFCPSTVSWRPASGSQLESAMLRVFGLGLLRVQALGFFFFRV